MQRVSYLQQTLKPPQFNRFFGLLVTTGGSGENIPGAAEGDNQAYPRPLAASDAIIAPRMPDLTPAPVSRFPRRRRRTSSAGHSDSVSPSWASPTMLGGDIDKAAAEAAARFGLGGGSGVFGDSPSVGRRSSRSGMWTADVRRAAYRNPGTHNSASTLGVRLGRSSKAADPGGLFAGSEVVTKSRGRAMLNRSASGSSLRRMPKHPESWLAQGSTAQSFMYVEPARRL